MFFYVHHRSAREHSFDTQFQPLFSFLNPSLEYVDYPSVISIYEKENYLDVSDSTKGKRTSETGLIFGGHLILFRTRKLFIQMCFPDNMFFIRIFHYNHFRWVFPSGNHNFTAARSSCQWAISRFKRANNICYQHKHRNCPRH